MKKFIFLIVLTISSIIIYAQNPITYTEAFDNVFSNISRQNATTGILYERVIPLARLQNFNSMVSTTIDTSSKEHFLQSYLELYNAAFISSGNLPFSTDSLESLIAASNSTVDIGILHYRFNMMDSTVASCKLYFGIDSVLYENTAINGSLYTERTAFIASPLKESIPLGTINFRFSNLFRFDNTGNPITQLWVDFDDGNGMQQISNTEVSITYSQAGRKTVHFQAILNNGDTFTAYAVIDCAPAPPQNAPRPSGHPYMGYFQNNKAIWAKIAPSNPYTGGTFSKREGNVWIYYANEDKKLRKPVLIVDGFDPENARTFEDHKNKEDGKSIWDMLFYIDEHGQDQHIGNQLIWKGYDLVVLDLPNGGTYIEENAMVCIEVINRINQMLAENGSEEEIVIVGPSMGGQITRYALTYMEKNPNVNTNYGNHNCRLWVSFDSPHQGANIAMGAQAFVYYFKGIKAAGDLWNNTLNSIAAQQMLIYHKNSSAASKHNTYYNNLRNLGYPSNLRKISISNGSLNNTPHNGSSGSVAFHLVLPYVLYNLDAKLRMYPSSGEEVKVFDVWHIILGIPIRNTWTETRYGNGFCSIDAASGCTYPTFKMMGDLTKKMGVVDVKIPSHCFMPITSVLDISGNINYCTNISNRDLVAEGKTPFNAYWGPTYKNMEHISFDNSLSTWVLREIETYTQGSKTIELCEYQNYTVHLPCDVSSSTEVFWTCSNNLIIVSGQGTKTITVKALATGDSWVQATVGSLTHSNLRTDAPSLSQSKKQLKKHYITVISSSPYASAPTNITQNTTWHTPYQINQPLTIENGATLVIQNTVHCGPLAKIIVEPGGRLIVDGGVLTNVCDGELWQGIEVWGKTLQQQNATNQGIVELKNEARIENAICGIYAGRRERSPIIDLTYLFPGGGIVYANNAYFINNQKAVYFATHVGGFNTSSQANNKSYFKNCEFILDDNALFDAPGTAQVELQGVKGVSFQNSLFKDERDRYSKSHLTNGIYANGASIRVGSSYWSLAPFSSDGCEFSGFDRAIYIQNSSTHQSQIYFSKFFNNGIGIDSYASNGLIVEGCEFHIPGYVYDNSRKQDGIRIEKSSGFTIENNFFTGDEGGNGIHFKDNGVGNHFVKSNSFENLCTGCSVNGVNGDTSQLESQGLVFQCNSFNNNMTDISISEDSRIRRVQSGRNNHASGNTFANSNNNIYNSSRYPLDYYFYDSNTAHHVNHVYQKYSGTVSLFPKDYAPCLSCGYAGSNYYLIGFLEDDINYLNNWYAQVKMVQESAISTYNANGFSNNTVDWSSPDVEDILGRLADYDFDRYVHIASDGAIEVRNTEIQFPENDPLSKQVFLSVHLTNIKGIMDEICYKALEILSEESEGSNAEQYRTWVSRLNTIESNYLLAESYMASGKFASANTVLQQMPAKFQELDMEAHQNYRDYYKVIRDIYFLDFQEKSTDHIGLVQKLIHYVTPDNELTYKMLDCVLTNGGYSPSGYSPDGEETLLDASWLLPDMAYDVVHSFSSLVSLGEYYDLPPNVQDAIVRSIKENAPVIEENYLYFLEDMKYYYYWVYDFAAFFFGSTELPDHAKELIDHYYRHSFSGKFWDEAYEFFDNMYRYGNNELSPNHDYWTNMVIRIFQEENASLCSDYIENILDQYIENYRGDPRCDDFVYRLFLYWLKTQNYDLSFFIPHFNGSYLYEYMIRCYNPQILYELVYSFMGTNAVLSCTRSELSAYFAENNKLPPYVMYELFHHFYGNNAPNLYTFNRQNSIPLHLEQKLIRLSSNNDLAGIKSFSLLEMMSVDLPIRDDRWDRILSACNTLVITPHKNASGYMPAYEEEIITDKEDIQVKVYPNPANNTVFISLDKMPETSVNYQLYDIQGKELQNGNFSSQKQELDIASLSKGIYFISVSVENQSKITKKVVKE